MTRFIVALILALSSVTIIGPACATVNEVTAANRYTGDGTTTVFNYTFEIYDQTALNVTVDGVAQVLTTDYTVSGVNNSGGGAVTFLSAPATGAAVTILRSQPNSQLSVYTANESFPAKRVEHDLDKLAMQVQQLQEQINRALLFKPQSTSTGQYVDDMTTTGLFARAKVGGGIDWASVTSSGTITVPVPVDQGGTGATTAATAAANLSVLPLVSGNVSQDLLFVDNNYDIGKTGATRPRDLFLSRNATIGGLIDASGASAGQVKFPASQNASADANTLDDYEEGVWTPSVGGTATYTRQNGYYTKIGRQVTITCDLKINAIGTGSASIITGLPFTSGSGTFSGAVYWESAAASYTSMLALIGPAGTSISLYGPTAASATISTANAMGSSTGLYFTVTYFTN